MVRDMRVLLSWFGTTEIPDGREEPLSPADVREGVGSCGDGWVQSTAWV